jgi:D-alanyl-D-alanine dipeptidase
MKVLIKKHLSQNKFTLKVNILCAIVSIVIFSSCQNSKELAYNEEIKNEKLIIGKHRNQEINDTTFVNLKAYSNDFVYDLKYASNDNFLKSKVYDCAECYLRLKTVEALISANKKFMKLGYKIKLFDCYRPLDIQKKMWKIVSNPDYVANPIKGSIHNRGGAVDLTLVDEFGNQLDMGTGFDFFGQEAGHNYKNLPENVLENRKLLKKILTKNGFKIFESEWWHYNLKMATKYKIANFKWKCE